MDKNLAQTFVAGDFNLISCPETIEIALARRLITPFGAAVGKLIDQSIWEDAFLKISNRELGAGRDEKDDNADEVVTFDRLNNPLASLSKGQVDDRPQRYDRVLWMKNKNIDIEVDSMERSGLPNEDGECGSDC